MFFPPELYQLIIQNVDTRADLFRLLLVSRLVSSEAERALYREIHLIRYDMALSRRLFLHLAHCQRVAHYVREMEIFGVDDSLSMDTLPDQYWCSINQALCSLSHLRVLELSTWGTRSPEMTYIPSDIFSNCIFRLEVLKLYNYWAEELPPIDLTHVKEFSLRYMASGSRTLKSYPGAFTSLQILTSSLLQFFELGIHNTAHVKALEISDTFKMNDNSFTNVTSLKIYSCPNRIGIQAFPSLRCLYYYEVFMDVAGVTACIPLESLATLKKLQKLSLVIYRPNVRYPPNFQTRFFDAISSLQEFVFGNMKSAQLWDRNGSEPVYIQVESFLGEWKDSRWL